MHTFFASHSDRDVSTCARCRTSAYADELDDAELCSACAELIARGPECDCCGVRALRPLDGGVCGGCIELEARRTQLVALLSARLAQIVARAERTVRGVEGVEVPAARLSRVA